jgi:hypothetical protein
VTPPPSKPKHAQRSTHQNAQHGEDVRSDTEPSDQSTPERLRRQGQARSAPSHGRAVLPRGKMRGSAMGAGWVVPVIVMAVIFIGAISWMNHSSNTASSGSAVNSRETTGSDTSSTGGR